MNKRLSGNCLKKMGFGMKCSDFPKIKIPDIDLVLELKKQSNFDSLLVNRTYELFDFIQAPAHGFLLYDVLNNFLEIEAAIQAVDLSDSLREYLDTTKSVLLGLEKLKGQEGFFHISSETYLDDLRKRIKQFDTETKRFFLSRCIFKKYRRTERYISHRPLYVSLFYPYIDKSIVGDDDLNDARITYRQLRAAAFFELSKNNLDGNLDKYKNLYEGIARSSDHRFYHPIKINRADYVVNATTAIRGIYYCLRTNKVDQKNEAFIEETKSKYDVVNVHNIYQLAEDQYKQLLRFFRYFLPSEAKETSNSEPLKKKKTLEIQHNGGHGGLR